VWGCLVEHTSAALLFTKGMLAKALESSLESAVKLRDTLTVETRGRWWMASSDSVAGTPSMTNQGYFLFFAFISLPILTHMLHCRYSFAARHPSDFPNEVIDHCLCALARASAAVNALNLQAFQRTQ